MQSLSSLMRNQSLNMCRNSKSRKIGNINYVKRKTLKRLQAINYYQR